ncbi:MAG TPA: aspartate kinase [Polyangiaceae bacterium LLY-WYZ-15_(1-7)]|nr:aspartate kinase [Sandaracinus sp.]HJL06177.1 aspartate kinase [Polyangiaceae bacterium LLY-WYZ-15_(1-7)]HJL11774.1 aspartate kinase [Polyangiaceae bacterium LLY-WYZ-15_(1-7)]HJL20686.1 aspartate kinase [Polyangiaceae bacterium LLY-WYZ-15_(1-7)]HJL30014.1 aspartate kinase [Polyangiaceae bacterium LLY-WYZ-15_(1-7)]
MSIVVQKYGGSSVADVEKIHRVAAKVVATRERGHDVVVVVSAMGKTTDELLGLAHAVDPSPPRRELDMLLSTGERISMALLSMAIQKRGVDAISFTGSQSGIITNDRHFDARIIDVRPHRVEDELARGRVVIVAGYQGMSYKREITTLGRGGSDTTALAMAAALGAEHAEIYSDVDGVYSADPRVAPDATHLPELSYDEMQEMAESGAKVLHAKAVEFARQHRIAIRARSTFLESGKETVVHEGVEPGEQVRAVVGQKGLARVSFDDGGEKVGFALGHLRKAGVVSRDLRTADGRTELLVVTAQTPDWEKNAKALRADFGATIEEGFGAVSAIGGAGDPALALVETLAGEGLAPTELIVTPVRVTVVLPEADTDAAVRAAHARLVG